MVWCFVCYLNLAPPLWLKTKEEELGLNSKQSEPTLGWLGFLLLLNTGSSLNEVKEEPVFNSNKSFNLIGASPN